MNPLQEAFDHFSAGRVDAAIQSYRASNSLAVYVKPVEKAGEIVGRVIDKGANSLDGVDYDHSNLEAKRDELRARAVKDAERRARFLCEGLARIAALAALAEAGSPFATLYGDTRLKAMHFAQYGGADLGDAEGPLMDRALEA